MPKKAGKKGKKKGGKKSKKSSGGDAETKKSTGSATGSAKSTGYLIQAPKPVRIPMPGENLLKVLTTHKVESKELHNMKISVRALEELTAQEIRDLRQVFEVFDSNADGFLTISEVRRALRALGFKVSREDARQMVTDYNQKGMTADFNAFLDFVIDRQGDARDIHDEILQGFKYFDTDDSGKITLANLKQVCREIGIKMTEQELQDMIEEADQNGDNMIDRQEFIRIMLQTNLF